MSEEFELQSISGNRIEVWLNNYISNKFLVFYKELI